MPMACRFLAKTVEELGELQQVLGKKLAYYRTDSHPDGKGSLKRRMEEEISDVIAVLECVIEEWHLDGSFISERTNEKYFKFKEWNKQQDNNKHAVDSE